MNCIYCKNKLGMRPLDRLKISIEFEDEGCILEEWDLE